MCDRIEADVVLMDLIMPKMDGVSATRAIRQRNPRVQVVALISFGEQQLLEEVKTAGAASYVLKSASIDQVARAVRAAVGSSISQAGSPQRRIPPVPPNPLSNNGDRPSGSQGPWPQKDVG
jgi:DNA-binding NarL/FixJ family response regulator